MGTYICFGKIMPLAHELEINRWKIMLLSG